MLHRQMADKLFTSKKNYYDTNERQSYMNRNLDLSQNEVKRVALIEKYEHNSQE